MSIFPAPIALPALTDQHLQHLSGIARTARDGGAVDEQTFGLMMYALPELLEELLRHRDVARRIQAKAARMVAQLSGGTPRLAVVSA